LSFFTTLCDADAVAWHPCGYCTYGTTPAG
jgi:hypothetical protein